MNKENNKHNNKKSQNKNKQRNNENRNNKTKSKDTKNTNIIKEDKKEIKKVIKEEKNKINDIDELEEEIDKDLEDFEKNYTEEEINDKIEEEEISEDDDIEEIDDDLEDFNQDKEEEIIKEKKKKEKKKKEEEISKEKIKHIENIAKEKKRKKQKRNETLKSIGQFLETNRYIFYSFIIGVLLTIFIVILIWPTRIATLKNGEQPIVKINKSTYTANDLYEQMKNHYSVSQLLDKIDDDLLEKLYPENEEMTKEVKENAEYYINMYKQYYNYTEEQFLSSNGFSSYDAFLEYLKLENRRKKYLDKYIEDNLTDKEIEDYYNKNVYGDINCQHILVETSTDSSNDSKKNKLSDEEGKKLAEEIIGKINDGTSWKDIQKEYKDKITFENLSYQSWDSDLEESFKTALKEMDDKSFSKEPVKTSYGYHIIYRIDQKKTPTLKKVKSKIVEKLIAQKKKDDSNIQYKALISLRKEKNIKFYDTDLEKKYDNYIKQYK